MKQINRNKEKEKQKKDIS